MGAVVVVAVVAVVGADMVVVVVDVWSLQFDGNVRWTAVAVGVVMASRDQKWEPKPHGHRLPHQRMDDDWDTWVVIGDNHVHYWNVPDYHLGHTELVRLE